MSETKTRKRDLVTARLAETAGCFATEGSCGYRSLTADGYTAFVAWDSADGRSWTVEVALVEGEDVPMPAGARRVLELEAEAGHRGSLERAIADAFAAL